MLQFHHSSILTDCTPLICVADSQEVFRKYSDKAKLRLCQTAWILYVLRNSKSNKKLIGEWQEDHTVENMKGGPVFQKSVNYGNNETIEKVTMVGCKVIHIIISYIFYVFIIPSKFANSYYVGYSPPEVNDEINEIKLLGFVEDVKLY